MAYLSSTSSAPNTPILEIQGIAGTRRWSYSSTHLSSDVEFANFFSDGRDLGMEIGDTLLHRLAVDDTVISHAILEVGATRTNLSLGTTVGLGS